MPDTNDRVIYRTNLRNALTITIGLALVWSFAILTGLHNGASITDPRVPLGVVVWLILSTNFLFGFYGELDKEREKFSRVSYFIFRKSLKLDEIKEIRYQPMFVALSAYDRSIFVVGIHNGKQVNLHYFSSRNFSENTLAQMARDLKEAAPQIRYDAPAEALVKKYFPQAG